MKYIKILYVITILFIATIGVNEVHAEAKEKKCYYISEDVSGEDFKATLTLTWGGDPEGLGDTIQKFAKVYVDMNGGDLDHDSEPLKNWIDVDGPFTYAGNTTDSPGGPTFEWYYDSFSEVENLTTAPDCPTYLVFEHGTWGIDTYAVWATESSVKAQQAKDAAAADEDHNVYVGISKKAGGGNYTAEDYYGGFVELGLIGFDQDGNLQCNDLFGDETDPDSLHSIINMVMTYVRIIVPILIILLGTIDFAKAVIAGKEDTMKKAQADFVMRVLIGVAVFFVPLLVNVIMDLAEIVWQGENYGICEIIK